MFNCVFNLVLLLLLSFQISHLKIEQLKAA